MYKVSIVKYYNTLPLRYGLEHSGFSKQIDLHLDIPSVCAQKLKDKTVDIGLVPVALIPELEDYRIVSDYCIGTNGKVDSVKLYSCVPLEEIKTVTLDYQSKSSITLVRVLNQYFWKLPFQWLPSQPGFENEVAGNNAAVIIGDRTFGLNKYPYQYDLAEEWQKFTGLPFVFACWVSNRQDIDASFIEAFNAAQKFGIAHTADAIAEQPLHIEGFDNYDYLVHKINYELDAPKQAALKKFLELIAGLD